MEKDRKRKIEIMTDIATNGICEGCGKCEDTPCDYYEGCARLYDKDYRMAEEVRKETAREIVNCLIDGGYISVARNIAEKYGFEDFDE